MTNKINKIDLGTFHRIKFILFMTNKNTVNFDYILFSLSLHFKIFLV
jgi:hypothetical protein